MMILTHIKQQFLCSQRKCSQFHLQAIKTAEFSIQNNLYRMQQSALTGKTFLFFFCLSLSVLGCQNDKGCKTCNLITFWTPMGLYGYYDCNACYANYTLNASTNVCDCRDTFYRTVSGTCEKCPAPCSSCSNASTCTACLGSDFRMLLDGQCQCIQGYEDSQNSTICTKKPNILLIALSTIGSLACLVIVLLCCWLVRTRHNLQIHEASLNAQTRQVALQVEASNNEWITSGNESSISLANRAIAKQWKYKQDQICSICLDSRPLVITACGHYFHPRCILGWLAKKHNSCPNCNQELRDQELRRWCGACTNAHMPLIQNVIVNRGGRKKVSLIQPTVVENQLCYDCENRNIEIIEVKTEK